MNLDGAIHGEWCHTVTYPTRCRYCGRDVFFFTCDHGCRVFFDELGPPWPLHECVGYLRSVVERAQLERYMRQDGRLDPNDLATSLALDAVYGAKVRQNAQRLPSFRTVRVEASVPAQAKGLGVVRQLQPCKDVPKALGAPDCGSLGLAMLGELARGRWYQTTVVTGDLAAADLQSYTGLVCAEQAEQLACKDLTMFTAHSFAYPGLRAIWVFDTLHAVME